MMLMLFAVAHHAEHPAPPAARSARSIHGAPFPRFYTLATRRRVVTPMI